MVQWGGLESEAYEMVGIGGECRLLSAFYRLAAFLFFCLVLW